MKSKNIVSIILSLIILLSVVPTTIFASDNEYPILDAIGLKIDAEAGKELTRLDLAKIAIELGGLEYIESGSSQYVDVGEKHYAFKIINTVTSYGYMGGNPDGSFLPDANASVADAAQVLLNLLGYSSMGKNAGWTSGTYLSKAQSIGLLKGVSTSGSLTKSVLGRLIVNMLEQPIVIISSIGTDGADYKIDKSTTYLTSRYGYYFKSGQMQAAGKSSITGSSGVPAGRVKVDGRVYNANGVDYSKYLGYNVRVIIDKDEEFANVIFMEEGKSYSDNIIDIPARNIVGFNDFNLTYMDSDGNTETVTIPLTCDIIVNGQTAVYDSRLFKPASGSVKLLDSDGDEVYDKAFITYELFYEVNGAIKNEYIGDAITGNRMNLNKVETMVYDNTASADISSVKSGSFVAVKPGAIAFGTNDIPYADNTLITRATIVKGLKEVSGKIVAKGSDSIEIGDREYKISGYYKKLIQNGYVQPFALNSYITAYLNEYDEIAIAKIDVETSVQNKKANYGVLMSLAPARGSAENLIVKLFTKEGDILRTETVDKLKFNNVKVTRDQVLADTTLFPSGSLEVQLIEFELDEVGLVTAINTAIDYTSPTIEYEGYDLLNFSKEFSGSSLYRNGFGLLYTFNDSSILFEIPRNPNDESKYKIRTGASAYIYNVTYDISIYDTNEEYIVSAAVIDYSKSSSGADEIRDLPENRFQGALKTFMIESVDIVLNDEGEEVRQLTGLAFDTTNKVSRKSLICQDDELKDTAQRYHIYEAYKLKKWNELFPGDIIHYDLDNEGKVKMFRLMFRAEDAMNATGTDVKYATHGTGASTGFYAIGVVEKITKNGYVIFRHSATKNTSTIKKGNTPYMLWIYENGKIREGTLDEVRTDDPVYFGAESGTLYEMIVYRD